LPNFNLAILIHDIDSFRCFKTRDPSRCASPAHHNHKTFLS